MNKLSPTVVVTQQLLKVLAIKHSISGLSEKLENHPDYPSLMAVSDCLTEWKIANETVQMPKQNYKEMPLPCIAHLNVNGGNFILITGIEDDNIKYSGYSNKNSLMSEIEFLKNWSGIILYAEADEESGESKYLKNKWKDIFDDVKLPSLLLMLLFGLGIVLQSSKFSNTLAYDLSVLINLLGLGVTVLLLVQSIDADNPFVQNLCKLGSKKGCNAILKTDAAKLTHWLSWSEVGFFYFAGSLLFLLINPLSLFIQAWLNLLVLPYVFYSLWYQYKHKSWCLLCCLVQLSLVLGSINTLFFRLWFFNYKDLQPSPLHYIPIFLFSFIFPFTVWYVLKPFFSQAMQLKPLKQQLRKFKYNSELFNQILKNQPRYSIDDDLMPIKLGNPKAEIIVTMVSNPYCRPCGKAHETLNGWLKFRNDLQLKIIFTTENEERAKVSQHINALTSLNNVQLVENALNDWYLKSDGKYESWAKKYPVNFNRESKEMIEKQKQWCNLAEISFTPTIFINGYKLPEPYRLEDIKYLIS